MNAPLVEGLRPDGGGQPPPHESGANTRVCGKGRRLGSRDPVDTDSFGLGPNTGGENRDPWVKRSQSRCLLEGQHSWPCGALRHPTGSVMTQRRPVRLHELPNRCARRQPQGGGPPLGGGGRPPSHPGPYGPWLGVATRKNRFRRNGRSAGIGVPDLGSRRQGREEGVHVKKGLDLKQVFLVPLADFPDLNVPGGRMGSARNRGSDG